MHELYISTEKALMLWSNNWTWFFTF